MNNWIIQQEIDLRRGIEDAQIWPNALMMRGDAQAHTWQVKVKRGEAPKTMTGTVTGYFERADGNTVWVPGTLEGNMASVTLDQACYAIPGSLLGVLRLSEGETTITLAVLRFTVERGTSDSLIDPGHVIPSLDDLLAKIEAMEKATLAGLEATAKALTAADTAQVAASGAEAAAGLARESAVEAGQAASSARAAAARWDTVHMDVTSLAANEPPTGSIFQTANATTIYLGIPQGRVTNATLYMDDQEMELFMRMPLVPEVGTTYGLDLEEPDQTELFRLEHGY